MWLNVATLMLCSSLVGADAKAAPDVAATPDVAPQPAAGNLVTPPVEVRDYTVTTTNEPGRCSIVIHPRAPWALKPTTPLEAVLQVAGSVTPSKTALSEKDYLDPKATDKTLVISYIATQDIDARLHTGLNFFLCTEQVCQRYKDTVDCKVLTASADAPAPVPAVLPAPTP